MKHLLAVALFAVCSVALMAQPVLGTATLPSPTRGATYQLADTVGVSIGSAGIDVIWDFTQLRPRDERPDTIQTRIVLPSALPVELQARYPLADRAVISDTLTEVFVRTPQTLRMLGVATPSADISFAESDPYDVRPVELRFGVEHLDTHSATITPKAVPIVVHRYGTHELIYDGWGDLLLPGAAAIKAARISMHRRTTDTVVFGLDTTLVTTDLVRTTWVSATSDEQFLEIDLWTIDRRRNGIPLPDTTTVRSVRYQKSLFTSVREPNRSALNGVFPLPVTGPQITITDLTWVPTGARLIDLQGRVTALETPTWLGSGLASLPVPPMPAGTYVLELTTGKNAGNTSAAYRMVIIDR